MAENELANELEDQGASPQWGPTVKLVVGLTFVAVIAAFLIQFKNIIGPLLLALILAYVLHPLLAFISSKTRLSWRASVNILYLIIIVVLIALLTATGVAAVQQAQNLFRTVDGVVQDLPDIVADLSTQVFNVGPYQLDMGQLLGQYDLERLLNQLLDILQPLLGQAGNLIRTLATSTLSGLGWMFFILLISYFTLSDAEKVPDVMSGLLTSIEIPGYREDLRKLSFYLGRIWNAFMRGQLILFLITVLTALIVLSMLGVRNSLVLAFIAGVARFVPYIGPFITWTITATVTIFQPTNYFGLEAFPYTLLVVGMLILLDQIFDNLVTPRLYGQTLGVHPAAVLVAAIVAANLIGFIGLLLAAPVLATLMLVGRYVSRKMTDRDPWPEWELQEGKEPVYQGILQRASQWLKNRFRGRKKDEQPEF